MVQDPAVMQFGLRVGAVEREIPSALLRAGSSLRLKNGYAQDDKSFKLHHYPRSQLFDGSDPTLYSPVCDSN